MAFLSIVSAAESTQKPHGLVQSSSKFQVINPKVTRNIALIGLAALAGGVALVVIGMHGGIGVLAPIGGGIAIGGLVGFAVAGVRIHSQIRKTQFHKLYLKKIREYDFRTAKFWFKRIKNSNQLSPSQKQHFIKAYQQKETAYISQLLTSGEGFLVIEKIIEENTILNPEQKIALKNELRLEVGLVKDRIQYIPKETNIYEAYKMSNEIWVEIINSTTMTSIEKKSLKTQLRRAVYDLFRRDIQKEFYISSVEMAKEITKNVMLTEDQKRKLTNKLDRKKTIKFRHRSSMCRGEFEQKIRARIDSLRVGSLDEDAESILDEIDLTQFNLDRFSDTGYRRYDKSIDLIRETLRSELAAKRIELQLPAPERGDEMPDIFEFEL